MIYFNGFSLQGEEALFHTWLVKGEHTVAGFSYGAQQALEYTLHTDTRVERLILLSPAFFQTQKASFIRAQLRYFDTGRDAYVSQFLKNVAYPSNTTLEEYLCVGSREELEALLSYVWDAKKLQQIQARGTVVEVFLGGKDKIIDVDAAYAFFSECAVTYFMKDAGHLLLN